jgi:N-acetylglutamate synthase-like GNAT family acetyltransferase
MTEANIRLYTPLDKSAVIDLLRQNTPEYFSPEEEQDFIHYLDNEIEGYYVVEYNNEVVGCGGVNIFPSQNMGRISWDMLHPAHQGKGLGGMLLKYRIDLLRNVHNVKTVQVRTSQLAYQFYAKFGFELKEIAKDFWAPKFDLYLMEYSLAS